MAGDEGRKWLLCTSRGERYGLELRWVRQIEFQPRILTLPTAEPPLLGLMSWRGAQVPALSLDQLLGHRSTGEGQAALMLEVAGRPLALLVEKVGETFSVAGGGLFGIDSSLAVGEGLVTEAIRSGQDLVFRLDAERLPLALVAKAAAAHVAEKSQ